MNNEACFLQRPQKGIQGFKEDLSSANRRDNKDWHLILAELAVYFKDRLGIYTSFLTDPNSPQPDR